MADRKTEDEHSAFGKRHTGIAIQSLVLLIPCMFIFVGCRRPASTASQARYLMGTIVEVAAVGEDSLQCAKAVKCAFDAMKEVDLLMSVYRPESQISELNRTGGDAWVRVDPKLFHVIASAQDYSRLSQGAFDVTAGPLVRLWGFFDKRGRLPSPEEEAEVRGRVGYRHLHLDPARTAVRFDRQGMEIDLGGIAKGYALDRAVDALRAEGVKQAVVNAGGNLFVLGGPASLALSNPINRDGLLCRIEVRDEAVSTSGASENFFAEDGVRYGHIFDPRAGRPVSNGLLSVTVVAPTGISSDALSTATFVLGRVEGMAMIERLEDVGAIFVSESADALTGIEILISSRLRGRVMR